ncbi:hypothetical protein CC80DRAFT_418994 [Byssothecium circinans]|uniref:Uncharacterized protein n=1 Tax=Byssothecium circinans TaxID=147558 RepID=A0A6A5TTK8_9PLEO|nr:hypothetical protein CC80DRAFT_418994 [Byssothecium circinans]
MQKTVAVVGGGPAGLVTAKTLLQHGGDAKFKVTVFEAAERIGGMWRSLPSETGVKCSPHMRTNLSRWTVAFSDQSWSSVDLSDASSELKASATLPIFPRAWQVGRYLEAYAKRFLPDVIRLNKQVTAVGRSGQSGTWNVTSIDTSTQIESKDTFDYLVIASGFFDRPAHNVRRSPGLDAAVRTQHSSEFRKVESLTGTPGKIVVIGGGISGSEAAATAAFQISSARHSPSTEKPAWAESTIYHVFNRPFYCLPRYIPQNPYNTAIQEHNLSPHFLPLDLNLYNLSRRGDGPIAASNGLMPPEKAKKGHEFIRSVIGGDQRDTHREELIYKPNTTHYPAFTGISDTYSDFVRSGLIVPVQGRVESIVDQPENDSIVDRFTVETVSRGPFANHEGSRNSINEVVGIIEATGFQVHLDYLAEDVKQALGYDPECHRVPFLLSPGSIFSPEVSNIAFVGFYEGPFWGVMEMQAHIVAQTWDTASGGDTQLSNMDVSQAQQVRDAIKHRAPNVPQFWMADYVGLIDEFSRLAGVQRDDSAFGGQRGPAFPARYCSTKTNDEALSVIREVNDILQQSENRARFVAAASFRGMQGRWTIQRKIDSRLANTMPGGTFKGTAHFHPRTPTSDTYAAEYLYVEEGTLTMDNGFSFPATRRYVYRYNEATDTITAWFVEENGLTTSTLFNTWEFYSPGDTYHGWFAKGHHWCSPDTYKNKCEFRFRGAGLETFGITYDVSGPKKDYSHESWYSRL